MNGKNICRQTNLEAKVRKLNFISLEGLGGGVGWGSRVVGRGVGLEGD